MSIYRDKANAKLKRTESDEDMDKEEEEENGTSPAPSSLLARKSTDKSSSPTSVDSVSVEGKI